MSAFVDFRHEFVEAGQEFDTPACWKAHNLGMHRCRVGWHRVFGCPGPDVLFHSVVVRCIKCEQEMLLHEEVGPTSLGSEFEMLRRYGGRIARSVKETLVDLNAEHCTVGRMVTP